MNILDSLTIAFRLARREIRGQFQSGLRGFRIFLACLALGVGAIAGVGTLSSAIDSGLEQKGQTLLGGDIELMLTQGKATRAEVSYLESRGRLSEMTSLRGMAYAPKADDRTMVELRAIDAAYPLYGTIELDGEALLAPALAQKNDQWGIAITPDLAARFNIGIGDSLKLGDTSYRIRALITHLPQGGFDGIELAPPVLVAAPSLPATGLVQYGSLIRTFYRLKLDPRISLTAFKDDLNSRFPNAGWRIRDRSNGAPGVRDFIDRMGLFLTLVGLTALLVGGVGVGNAVSAHLEGRINTLATLKTLGASGRMIFALYLIEVLLMAALGIIAGVAAGAFAPILFKNLLASHLPVPPVIGFYPRPLLLAAAYGFAITLCFSVWPLARARDIPAQALYRRLVSKTSQWPRWPYILLTGFIGLSLAAIALLFSGNLRFTTGFIVAALASLGLLKATGWLIQKAASLAPRFNSATLRMAVRNLYRPGAATGTVVLSLGLGLTLFAAILEIEGNLSARIHDQLPDEAPAFFFIDIQKDQIGDFERQALSLPGVTGLTITPYLRGRIAEIKGVSVTEARIAPDARWATQGDRGLTYANTLPKGNQLVAGGWWPMGYAGPPEISLDANLAKGMGLTLGDRMVINVLGRDLTVRIASLRQIDWGTLGVNFAIIFDPYSLKDAPNSYLAALKVPPLQEAAVHKSLGKAFPNVSAVRMRDVLATVNNLLGQIGSAVRMTASLTILSGILVLAGAVAAGQRQRLYDAVILKILGATRRHILKILLLEYALLGVATALVSMALGTLGAWVVVTRVMSMDWTFNILPLIATTLLSLILTVAFGLLGTWQALKARPSVLLREA
jgi:putative ABC transport system permease protein